MDLAQARSHPSSNHPIASIASGDTKDQQPFNGEMQQPTEEDPISLVLVRCLDSPQSSPPPPPLTPPRQSEQNWARVRARMIGPLKDPQLPRTPVEEPPARILQAATACPPPSAAGNTRVPFSQMRKGKGMATKLAPGTTMSGGGSLADQRRGSTFSSNASTAVETTAGTFGNGLRGVLGFRTVVEQRTHLRRMEKEIEKVLARYSSSEQANLLRVRTATTRIRTETTRSFMPGATYNMALPATDTMTPDAAFLTELSETLSRWKNLTVEVPYKEDILREFSKMLRADRSDPLSGPEAMRVLDLFERMRALYPFVSDINDLHDVRWLLNLLSRQYVCDKRRVWHLIQTLLVKLPSSPTLPLSARNIQSLLYSIVALLAEQRSLPKAERDPAVYDAITNLMERLEKGDLALGNKKHKKLDEMQEKARIVFLQALMECLRAQDPLILTLLTRELIPKYWASTDASEVKTLDEAVTIFAQAVSEMILSLSISADDHSEAIKNVLIDLATFMTKSLPPAGLEGIFSDKAIDALIKATLTLFSIQYRKKPPERLSIDASEHLRGGHGNFISESNVALPPLPTPHPLDNDSNNNNDQSLPSAYSGKSPASPKVSGENFIPRVGSTSLDYSFVQDAPDPLLKLARQYFDELWEQGFERNIIRQLSQQLESGTLQRVVHMYHRLCLGSREDISNSILKSTLATFFNKLIMHQPPKEENLTRLLCQLSIYRRAAFFRPMMGCVASDSTQTVTDYLCILSCLQRHLSPVDIFMRDADMMCVIIMTDVGHDRPTKDIVNEELRWGSCTVGQCIIILEFIHAIKRLAKSDQYHDVEVGKMFLIELERKLGIYLIAKERRILVPRPIRVLLCVIFFQVRSLCKTIHRPGWLVRVIDWATNYALPPEQKTTNDMIELGISETMFLRIKHVYSNVDNLTRERNALNAETAAMSIDAGEAIILKDTPEVKLRNPFKKPTTVPGRVNRLDRFLELELDESVALLTALITVQSTIMTSEYIALASPLWNTYLLDARPKVASSAAFLFVKCADVAPKMIFAMVTNELYGPNATKRLATVERLKEIFSHRSVLMSQPFVIDPSSKGPFKQIASQIPFVPSDVGSNRYTMDEPRWLTKLKDASNFPADIRNRFQELNWGEKDKHEIELIRREQTPLALLWSGYLDEEYESLQNFGKAFTTQPKSKHAAVVIPVINSLNLCVIDLIDDNLIGVRTMARVFMQDYMRNEPVLFLRFFFTEIAYAELPRQTELYNRLHALLSSTSQLPPGFAFGLFNHLFGLLRWYQRAGKVAASEQLEAVMPLLTAVVTSTNDIVFKDFRRNKLDQFLGTLGFFWFRPGLQPESMFPKRLTSYRHQFNHLSIPLELFRMTLTNINQIHFMTDFLVRYPTELYNIIRSIGRYNRMPKLDDANAAPRMEDNQYLADAGRSRLRYAIRQTPQERTISSLGSLRARMWLRFLLKLFKRLNKNYADRLQLMNLFNGVNVILLEYGHDFGILGQALDIYVTAATQIRRFFAYQNGYNLIFPALFKMYCDSERLPRVCDTLNAVFHRFYLLHQEAFVLQSLGSIVPLMLRQAKSTEVPTKIMARRLFAFFEALADPDVAYTDAFGLQSLAEPLQDTSHGKALLDLPQWMASFIPQHSRLFQTSTLMFRDTLSVEDACKLFLSVIAFDPGSLRSEQFIRAYQLMLPYFWRHEEDLVRRGFDSLVALYAKFAKNSKPLVASNFKMPPILPRENKDDPWNNTSRFALCETCIPEAQEVKGKSWVQNDRVAVKHEFLVLLQVYCKLGGRLSQVQHLEVVNIARSILKDYHSINAPCTTDWLKEYVQGILLASEPLKDRYSVVLHFVHQFVPLFKSHYLTMDWTGFLKCLCLVATDFRQYLRHRIDLAKMIHEKVVSVGLQLGLKDNWRKECTASGAISHARFCDALVELIIALINHSDMDTIHELEKMEGSPLFMAYFVVPICLRFQSCYETSMSGSDSGISDVVSTQFWLRMLGLTIQACVHDPELIVRRAGRSPGLLLAPVLNATKNAIRQNSADLTSPLSPRHRRSTITPLIPQTPGLVPTTPNPFLTRPQDMMYIPSDIQSPRVPSTPNPFQRAQSFQARQNTTSSVQPVAAATATTTTGAAPTTTMNATPALIINFIALRIILVRGERFITAQPGYWLAVFQFVQRYFAGQYALLDYYTLAMFSSQARQGMGGNSSQGGGAASNPATPMPMTPFPTTPHGEGGPMSFFHQSPQEHAQNGLLASVPSPMPGSTGSVTTPFSMQQHRASMQFRNGSVVGASQLLPDVTALDMMPTTSLGFVLWSFVETVMYARLPLFALMRPFVYEQLGLVDSYGVVVNRGHGSNVAGNGGGLRGDRSGNSSGQNTPAFYWPSPSIDPMSGSHSPLHTFHNNNPTGGDRPFSSHHRHPSHGSLAQGQGKRPNDPTLQSMREQRQDPEQRRAGRQERRNQWKSWSRQNDGIIMSSTAAAVPYGSSVTPMSPQAPTTSRLSSRMSTVFTHAKSSLQDWTSEHFPPTPSLHSASRLFGRGGAGGGGAASSHHHPLSVTRDSVQQPLQQPNLHHQHLHGAKHKHSRYHHHPADGSSLADVPAVLVERANRSLRHVRVMLLGSEDAKVDLALIRPSSSSKLNRLGPTQFAHHGLGDVAASAANGTYPLRPFGAGSNNSFSNLSAHPQHQYHGRQFLAPGDRYERPPVSPGFGAMFLAREAALRAAASSGDVSGGIGSSSLFPIPPPSPGGGGGGSGRHSPASGRKPSNEDSYATINQGAQSRGSLLSVPGQQQQQHVQAGGSSQGEPSPFPASSSMLLQPLAPPSPLQLSPISAAISSLPLRRSESHASNSAISSLTNIEEEEPDGREFQNPLPFVTPTTFPSQQQEQGRQQQPPLSPTGDTIKVLVAISGAAEAPETVAGGVDSNSSLQTSTDHLNLPMFVVESPSMGHRVIARSLSFSEQQLQQQQQQQEQTPSPMNQSQSMTKKPQNLSVITSLPVISIHGSDEAVTEGGEASSNQQQYQRNQPSLQSASKAQTPPLVTLQPVSSLIASGPMHESGMRVSESPEQALQLEDGHTAAATSSTPMATTGAPPANMTPKKKRRSILKPRIITTSPPHLTIPKLIRMDTAGGEAQEAPAASPAARSHMSEPTHARPAAPTDDHDLLLPAEERECYRMGGRQTRIKLMMESLEEEARLVIASFPAIFVPGYQKLMAEKERQQHHHHHHAAGSMANLLASSLLQKTNTQESDQVSLEVAPVGTADNRSMTSLGHTGQPQQQRELGRSSTFESVRSGTAATSGGVRKEVEASDTEDGGFGEEPNRSIAQGIPPELNPVIVLPDNGAGVQPSHQRPELKSSDRRRSRLSLSAKAKQFKSVMFHDSKDYQQQQQQTTASPTSHMAGTSHRDHLEAGSPATMTSPNSSTETGAGVSTTSGGDRGGYGHRTTSSTTSLPRFSFSSASPPSPEQVKTFASPVHGKNNTASRPDGQLLARAASTSSRDSASSSASCHQRQFPKAQSAMAMMQYPTISVSEPVDSEDTSPPQSIDHNSSCNNSRLAAASMVPHLHLPSSSLSSIPPSNLSPTGYQLRVPHQEILPGNPVEQPSHQQQQQMQTSLSVPPTAAAVVGLGLQVGTEDYPVREPKNHSTTG